MWIKWNTPPLTVLWKLCRCFLFLFEYWCNLRQHIWFFLFSKEKKTTFTRIEEYSKLYFVAMDDNIFFESICRLIQFVLTSYCGDCWLAFSLNLTLAGIDNKYDRIRTSFRIYGFIYKQHEVLVDFQLLIIL